MTLSRVLSAGERAATQGSRDSYYRLRVTNPDGAWLNLGALTVNGTPSRNFNNAAQVSASIDENTVQLTATLRREIGTLSLSPLREDSPLNARADFTYGPALDLRRLWVLEVAVMPHEVPPAESNFRPLAEGIITALEIHGEHDGTGGTIGLAGRGMETPLLATEQLTEQEYPGAAILVRLQAMLDKWNTGVTAVADGSAPSYFVNAATTDSPQPVGPLMPALQEIASLPGAVARYMYDASDVNRFTLFTPNRSPTVADWVLGPREYKEIPMARLDLDSISNYIELTYFDAALQQNVTITSPSPEPSTVSATAGAATFSVSPGLTIADGAVIVVAGVPYTVSAYSGGTTATLSGSPTFTASSWVTSASITRYGLKPFVIGLAQATNVTDSTSGGLLIDAMRSDLEFPAVEWQVETEGGWFLQLYDYLELARNATHNSTSQFGGVTSVVHNFAGGKLMTTVGLRGRPAGGYRSWLSFGSNSPRIAPTPQITQLTATAYEGTVFAARVTGVVGTANTNQYARSVAFDLATTADMAVVLDTFSADVTALRADAIFTGTTPDTIYWVRGTPYSGPLSGGVPTGVAGPAVVASTFSNRLTPSQPQFDTAVADIATNAADIATETAARIAADALKADVTYVDAKVAGLSWKQAVRAATTSAGTLASSFENGDTIDGVTLATGDRILIKNQAAGAENGIYVVAASGAPTRATDADAGAELVNATVYVSEGTANADTQWTCTTNATITVGSTSLAFAQMSSGGGAVSSVFGRTGAVVKVAGDYAVADVTGAAPLVSPALTGTPTVPTAAPGTNTTQAASTAFVIANASAVGWRYSVASSCANGNSRDMIQCATVEAAGGFIVSVKVSRLAYSASAIFFVPFQTFAGTSAWSIARPVNMSASAAEIGLEVQIAGGTILFRHRNQGGLNHDSVVMTAQALTESAPTWSSLSATAALATTALYDPARVLLPSLEQGGATSRQALLWDATGLAYLPSTIAVADVTGAAPLASPVLTGTPTVPTAAAGTATSQAASTAFVVAALAAGGFGGSTPLYTIWDPLIPDGSPHALNDEFTSNTIGNYTTVYGNGDSTALVDIHTTHPNHAYFNVPSIQYHMHSLLRALPAGDFSIYAGVTLAAQGGDATFAGIVLSTASTAGSGAQAAQTLARASAGAGVQITMGLAWNGFGSSASGASSTNANYCEYPLVVLRLQRVGTTVTRAYSVNGKDWLYPNAITNAAWTHFGIFLQNYPGNPASASFKFLRYYASGTQNTTGGLRAVYG